ncbi:MAG TPA: 30S ribosomal protein S9 [bacterium]|jgi:small subunit ribosomal protein S9|nr:30S ribosomal protein S9 [bacterium]
MATAAPQRYMAIGRRKTSVARVVLSEGTGTIKVNGLEADAYFARPTASILIRMPLVTVDAVSKVDVKANCSGGGKSGQAGALRMGIARALCKLDPDNRPALAKAGLMTRDPRMVERKKYGQSGARKRFQFSKR